MPGIGIGVGLPFGALKDPFIQYEGANGITIDESNKGYSSAQIDYAISIFATCTNCTIDISGANDNRTAGSNDDLNTVFTNGNTIALNDTLSAELITNGDFAVDANWTKGSGWSIAAGVATHTPSGGGTLFQTGIVTATKIYRFQYDVLNHVAGIFRLRIGDGTQYGINRNADGTYVEYYTVTATGYAGLIEDAVANGDIDNYSVKEVTFV